MEEDDLYAQLFGEAAPVVVERKPPLVQPPAAQPILLPAAPGAPLDVFGDGTLVAEPRPAPAPPALAEAAAEKGEIEESDEELDVVLNEPTPRDILPEPGLQQEDADDDDDELDILLNEPQASTALVAQASAEVAPGLDLDEGTAASLGAPGGGQAPASVSGAPIGVTLDDPPALPSQAKPGQAIRLPGQTRVTSEEYREFLGLGHGDVFTLDIDRVVDAPWRQPGASHTDFFNYGLTPATWKEYCNKVKQYQLEYSLQRNIQVYNSSNGSSSTGKRDLPPELAAMLPRDIPRPIQHWPQFRPPPPRPPPIPPPRPPPNPPPLDAAKVDEPKEAAADDKPALEPSKSKLPLLTNGSASLQEKKRSGDAPFPTMPGSMPRMLGMLMPPGMLPMPGMPGMPPMPGMAGAFPMPPFGMMPTWNAMPPDFGNREGAWDGRKGDDSDEDTPRQRRRSHSRSRSPSSRHGERDRERGHPRHRKSASLAMGMDVEPSASGGKRSGAEEKSRSRRSERDRDKSSQHHSESEGRRRRY